MNRLKTIFPDNWFVILEAYKRFAGKSVQDKLILGFVEIGVKSGEMIAELNPNNFLEIGCGLAIPSLTLSKLGIKGGRAVDIDPKVISIAEELKKKLNCDFETDCSDVFNKRPEIRKDQMIIAEKPVSYKKSGLEVEFNISNRCMIEGNNLALIPAFLKEDTIKTYLDRCFKYEKKFRQSGFKVKNQQLIELLPYRQIIAYK